MSLINDALKRVEGGQQPTGNASSLRPSAVGLRATESADEESGSKSRLSSAAGVLLLGAALAAGWMFLKATDSKSDVPQVRARPASELPAPGSATPQVATGDNGSADAAEVQGVPDEPAAPGNALVHSAKPSGGDEPQPAGWDTVPGSSPTLVSTADAPVLTGTAPGAELKLQAIIKHPKRPSAMVNGKSLFIGDSLGQFTLVRVTLDSVTLRSPSGEQVLRLGQ